MATYTIGLDYDENSVSLTGHFVPSRDHEGIWPEGVWNASRHSTFYHDNRASEETKRELAKQVLVVHRSRQIAPETINRFSLLQDSFVFVTPKVRDAIQAIDADACEFFHIPQVYCQRFKEELSHRDYHAMNPLRRLQSWDLEETNVRISYTAKGEPLTNVRYPGKFDQKTVEGGFIWRDYVTEQVFCDDRFVECLDGIENVGIAFSKYYGNQ